MKQKFILKMMKKFTILIILLGAIYLNNTVTSNKNKTNRNAKKPKQSPLKKKPVNETSPETDTTKINNNNSNNSNSPSQAAPQKPAPYAPQSSPIKKNQKKSSSTPAPTTPQNTQSTGFINAITNNKIESVIVAAIIGYGIYYAQKRGHIADAKEYLAKTGTKIKELFQEKKEKIKKAFKKLKTGNIIPVKYTFISFNNTQTNNFQIIENLFKEFPLTIFNRRITKIGFFNDTTSIGNIDKINLNLNQKRIELTINVNGEENIIHITPNNFDLNENNQLNPEDNKTFDDYTIQFFEKDNKTKMGGEVLFSDLKTILKTDSQLGNKLSALNKDLAGNPVIKSWHDKLATLVEEENKRIKKLKELEEQQRRDEILKKQNELEKKAQKKAIMEEWVKERNNLDMFAKKGAETLAIKYLSDEKTKSSTNKLEKIEITKEEISALSQKILDKFTLQHIINENNLKISDEWWAAKENGKIQESNNAISSLQKNITDKINNIANQTFSDINLKKFIEKTIKNVSWVNKESYKKPLLYKEDNTDYSELIKTLIPKVKAALSDNQLFYGNDEQAQKALESTIDKIIVPEIKQYSKEQEEKEKKKHEEEEKQKKQTQEVQKKAVENKKTQTENAINDTITEMAHHHNVMQENKDHTTGWLWGKTTNEKKKNLYDDATKKYKGLSEKLNTQFKDLYNETNNDDISYTVTPTIMKTKSKEKSDYHTMQVKKNNSQEDTTTERRTYQPSPATTNFAEFKNSDGSISLRKPYTKTFESFR